MQSIFVVEVLRSLEQTEQNQREKHILFLSAGISFGVLLSLCNKSYFHEKGQQDFSVDPTSAYRLVLSLHSCLIARKFDAANRLALLRMTQSIFAWLVRIEPYYRYHIFSKRFHKRTLTTISISVTMGIVNYGGFCREQV